MDGPGVGCRSACIFVALHGPTLRSACPPALGLGQGNVSAICSTPVVGIVSWLGNMLLTGLRTRCTAPPPPRRPVSRGDGGVCGAGDGGAAAARRGQPAHPGLPVAGGARGVAAPVHRRLHQVRRLGEAGRVAGVAAVGAGGSSSRLRSRPQERERRAQLVCGLHAKRQPPGARPGPAEMPRQCCASLVAGSWRGTACAACWRCPSRL